MWRTRLNSPSAQNKDIKQASSLTKNANVGSIGYGSYNVFHCQKQIFYFY